MRCFFKGNVVFKSYARYGKVGVWGFLKEMNYIAIIILKGLSMKKQTSKAEFELQVNGIRESLEKDLQRNFQKQEQVLDFFIKNIQFCEERKLHGNKLIWNIGGYISMVSYDLKIIGKELALLTGKWQRIFFARQAYLLIFESLNDLLQLLGKDFRAELKKLNEYDSLEIELKKAVKDFTDFKKLHEPFLKEVRDTVTAHRNKDVLAHYKLINSIDWTEAIDIVTSYDQRLNNLGKFIQKILKLGGQLDRN